MSDSAVEVIHGSGNVFRDMGIQEPDLHQLRSRLAAEIIKALDGISGSGPDLNAADMARIRNVRLDPFTTDRLMIILSSLGRDVDVKLSVAPRDRQGADQAAA